MIEYGEMIQMNWKKILIKYLLLFFLMLQDVMAYEEAEYKVVYQGNNFEIRFYDERVVVQAQSNSGNNSFRKLFNYISGKNQVEEKIEMTTPVTELLENNKMIMQFYLPSRFDANSAPLPADNSLEIATIDAGYFAVIQYSGFASNKNFNKHAQILKSSLDLKGVKILSQPIKATYDGPFTLPQLRRNEAMFLVNWNK